jgi:hypothetical protein
MKERHVRRPLLRLRQYAEPKTHVVLQFESGARTTPRSKDKKGLD